MQLYFIVFAFLALSLLTACPDSPEGANRIAVPTQLGIADKNQDEAKDALRKITERLNEDPYAQNEGEKQIGIANGKVNYVPSAKGKLPEANRQDFKILDDVSISYVLTDVLAANGKFSLSQHTQTLKRFDPPKDNHFRVVVQKDLLSALAQEGAVKLPILWRGFHSYRAEAVCYSSEDGKCVADADLLSDSQFSESEDVPLFPTLKHAAVMPAGATTLTITYYYMPQSRESSISNEKSPYAHPGDSAHLKEIVDTALHHYIKEFGTKADACMADFVAKFGLADCDMVALAEAQALNKHYKQFAQAPVAVVALGNRVKHGEKANKILDARTHNHAWGGETTRESVKWRDATPHADDNLAFAMNQDLVNKIKSRLEQSKDFDSFSSWNLGKSVTVTKSGALRPLSNFDKLVTEQQDALLEKLLPADQYEKLPNHWDAPKFRSKANQSLVTVRINQKYQHGYDIGGFVAVKTPGRSYPWTRLPFHQGKLVGGGGPPPADGQIPQVNWYGFGTENEITGEKPKLTLIEVTEKQIEGKYEFSPVPAGQEQAMFQKFLKAFNATPIPGHTGENGGRPTMSSQGVMQISHYGNKYAGNPPTAAQLAEFWRSQGYRVSPEFELTVTVAVTIPQKP